MAMELVYHILVNVSTGASKRNAQMILCAAHVIVSLRTFLVRAESICGILQMSVAIWAFHGDAFAIFCTTVVIIQIITSAVMTEEVYSIVLLDEIVLTSV